MVRGFGALGMSDRGRRGKVLADHRDATNKVRSMPLETVKRVSMEIEPVGAHW
jgi:hypothetical protein